MLQHLYIPHLQFLCLEVNAGIVTDVTKKILEHSEDPIIIVVTNPLDQMTTLTAEVSKLSKNKVIGQAGILDSSRFAYFISEKLNVKMSDVYALTLGSHGETMVPVPSLCTVSGEPLVNILSKDDIDELVSGKEWGVKYLDIEWAPIKFD